MRASWLLAMSLACIACDTDPEMLEADWPDFAWDAQVDRGFVVSDQGVQIDRALPQVDGAPPDAGMNDARMADARMADAQDATVRDATLPDAFEPDASPPPDNRSLGCGTDPMHRRQGVQIDMDFGPEADGMRGFYLWVPNDYDPAVPHRLVFAYPGTNWVGQQIRPYLDMERASEGGTIFVYLDPLWRDFNDWGFLGGWLLGPDGWNAQGMGDLIFTERLLDLIESQYCIDRDRIFTTGHSWGGDMAHVVACFLGDRFRAAAPAAANRPFWFAGRQDFCAGETAIWTFFGIADDHFNVGSAYGDECRDFWLAENACTGVDAHAELNFGPQEECFEYDGCTVNTRYCLYGPQTAHQIPQYFSAAVMEWFEGF